LLNPVEKRRLKPLIVLNFYIFSNRVTSRISCGDRQHQSNGKIRPNAWLHPYRAGTKKSACLCRLFSDFKGNLRRQMERRRQDGGTSLVCLRKLRGLDISLIGIAIRLHQLAKPPANFTQPLFYFSLPAEARAHHPQRGREGSHQSRDRAAGRNWGRRGHPLQKIHERLCAHVNRLLFARRDQLRLFTEQPSLQSRFQHLR
jgi:hypothetical protein